MRKWFTSIQNNLFGTFIPWIFFAIFYAHTTKAILIGCLGAFILTILFNFKRLTKGFILSWGSIILFLFLPINTLCRWIPISEIQSLRLINSTLAAIALFSMLIGKPFTIQYAKEEINSSYWHHPLFLKINWILTSIWAVLMIMMALPSYFLTFDQIHYSWFWNYGFMIICVTVGMQCTRYIRKIEYFK